MSIGKVHTGDILHVLPAQIQNDLIDIALDYRRTKAMGLRDKRWTALSGGEFVVLKNGTGANLAAGRVLEIGSPLITTPDNEHLWFAGAAPSPDGVDTFAVALRAMPSNAIEPCMVSGIVKCRINVNHVQHHYCDVDSSSTLLQSKWHGRGEILWKSTAATGEQDAVIRLGEMFRGPIKGAAATGLARGSSASVTVYWAGAVSNPANTVTVHWNWMDGGPTDVPTNGELLFGWHPDEQKYVLWNAECEHA